MPSVYEMTVLTRTIYTIISCPTLQRPRHDNAAAITAIPYYVEIKQKRFVYRVVQLVRLHIVYDICIHFFFFYCIRYLLLRASEVNRVRHGLTLYLIIFTFVCGAQQPGYREYVTWKSRKTCIRAEWKKKKKKKHPRTRIIRLYTRRYYNMLHGGYSTTRGTTSDGIILYIIKSKNAEEIGDTRVLTTEIVSHNNNNVIYCTFWCAYNYCCSLLLLCVSFIFQTVFSAYTRFIFVIQWLIQFSSNRGPVNLRRP